MKQTFAGIVGSLILAGCLSDPNIVYVPDTTDTEDEDDTETAMLWSAPDYPAPEPFIEHDLLRTGDADLAAHDTKPDAQIPCLRALEQQDVAVARLRDGLTA
jgi:hypothetical protein